MGNLASAIVWAMTFSMEIRRQPWLAESGPRLTARYTRSCSLATSSTVDILRLLVGLSV
jgi:hypothetical protein